MPQSATAKTVDPVAREASGARPAGMRRSDCFALGVLVIVMGIWILHVRVGWGHETLTGHEFRQAQTALTIQAVERDGMRLDYSTPVLGKPWAIPMEFPLYQWLVATGSEWTGMETAQAGRAVSVLAFLGGLSGVLLILRSAGLSWGAGFWLLAVVVGTPVYAFYTAAVLIESTAWGLSIWFLWGVLRYRQTQLGRYLIVAFLAGLFAVLVKPTTWAVACLPWSLLWCKDLWQARVSRDWRPLVLQAVVLGGVLLVVGYAWVAYADQIKARNPIAQFLLSDQLTGFNFGTWDMKMSVDTWGVLAAHWNRDIAPGGVLVVGSMVALLFSRSRPVLALGWFAFIGIQLVFTNLYVTHDYYLYANAAFVVIAATAGLAVWWDRNGSIWVSKVPAALLFLVLILGQFNLYRSELFQGILDRPAHAPKLPVLLKKLTHPDDVIVGQMGSWSSRIAYHSERRMLMIPDSEMFLHPERVDQSIGLLQDEAVPLLLVSGETSRQPQWVARRLLQLEMHPVPLFVWNHDITVFARFDRYRELLAQLDGVELVEVIIPDQLGLVHPDEVAPLSAEDREEIAAVIRASPAAGDFPHGLLYANLDGTDSLLIHAPTDLIFEIPAGTRRVNFSYVVPAHVFEERDFDGLMMIAESWEAETGEHTALWREWVPPGSSFEVRHRTLELQSAAGGQLLLRVEAGPFNQNAFDQAWLQTVEFVPVTSP